MDYTNCAHVLAKILADQCNKGNRCATANCPAGKDTCYFSERPITTQHWLGHASKHGAVKQITDLITKLKIRRDDIANGDIRFIAEDCIVTGAHSLRCTWGFCNDRMICPLNTRLTTIPKDVHEKQYGCFHKCLVFKGRHGFYSTVEPERLRPQVLDRYDTVIAQLEKRKDEIVSKLPKVGK